MNGKAWLGASNRECGEHREGLKRAWCFDCGAWCYPNDLCPRCELPDLRLELQALKDQIDQFLSGERS